MTVPHIVAAFALVVIGCGLAAPFAAVAWRRFRAQGAAFSLIALGFLYAAATKPSVTWDSYIQDNGSHFTNDNSRVCFRWTKTNAQLPGTEPLYVSRQPMGDTSAEWVLTATTTAGALAYDLDGLANPTNYRYFVWHEWSPPSPVHTNGVWLGTIIAPAVGETNAAAKMVIVNGQLLKNGKVIATP